MSKLNNYQLLQLRWYMQLLQLQYIKYKCLQTQLMNILLNMR